MDAPQNSTIPPEILADLDAVCRQAASGRIQDHELLRRIEERSQKARKEIFQNLGLLNVAVDLIREGRDEE